MDATYTEKLQGEVMTSLDQILRAHIHDFPTERLEILAGMWDAAMTYLEQESSVEAPTSAD